VVNFANVILMDVLNSSIFVRSATDDIDLVLLKPPPKKEPLV
jgi:hypothetical protein